MKSGAMGSNTYVPLVAPHWGAWIEMHSRPICASDGFVAPHWGAWIEIMSTVQANTHASRTPLGCVD